tara:strand:- start:304 stop:531 length:228 start_codon:yes stop_codon:yes gene_type:complete
MYSIKERNKNGSSLYTVVYSYGQLSFPVCQSGNYQDCVEYINKQPQEPEGYNEEEAQQSLTNCLTQMYKNRNNGK